MGNNFASEEHFVEQVSISSTMLKVIANNKNQNKKIQKGEGKPRILKCKDKIRELMDLNIEKIERIEKLTFNQKLDILESSILCVFQDDDILKKCKSILMLENRHFILEKLNVGKNYEKVKFSSIFQDILFTLIYKSNYGDDNGEENGEENGEDDILVKIELFLNNFLDFDIHDIQDNQKIHGRGREMSNSFKEKQKIISKIFE